jgi:hypothetical protein
VCVVSEGDEMVESYCVACGARQAADASNHHCDPKRISRKDSMSLRGREDDYRKPTEAMRLNYGFHLLRLSGD